MLARRRYPNEIHPAQFVVAVLLLVLRTLRLKSLDVARHHSEG